MGVDYDSKTIIGVRYEELAKSTLEHKVTRQKKFHEDTGKPYMRETKEEIVHYFLGQRDITAEVEAEDLHNATSEWLEEHVSLLGKRLDVYYSHDSDEPDLIGFQVGRDCEFYGGHNPQDAGDLGQIGTHFTDVIGALRKLGYCGPVHLFNLLCAG